MSASRLLTSAEVMRRYHLRDPRTARQIMREAGAMLIGGRMLVDAERLAEYEAHRQLQRLTPTVIRSTIAHRVEPKHRDEVPDELDREWYRDK